MKLFFSILITSLLIFSSSAQELTVKTTLTLTDEESLLYMLEEEKLARDVYTELYALWGANRFNNISISEQNHMDEVEALLVEYDIAYTILPSGQYNNPEFQTLHNDLMALGQTSLVDAYVVGMTIEDVDIYDLQLRITETSTQAMIDAYQFLICGSGNHMRAFYDGLTANGGTYSPQFITQEEYDIILSESSGPCDSLTIDEFINPNAKVLSSTVISDSFSVVLSGISVVYIYTVNGKLVKSMQVKTDQEISVKNFTEGVYYIKVINNKKSILIKTLKQ
ncbi:MAG TPA: DUF2202 domain-containing protein [Lutibacter sp.]|nr:DUF2202 domain-containing protein [Lutibacter sp.]